MKKILLVAVLTMFATMTAVFAQEAPDAKKAGKTSVIYTCEKCPKVALKAGQCCGEDLKAMKVLSVKDGCACCCRCTVDCKCTANNCQAVKCVCDKEVKQVGLKGMFCCDKDGVIADKEGKCPVCAGDLKAAPEPKCDEKAAAPKAEEKKAEENKPAAQ